MTLADKTIAVLGTAAASDPVLERLRRRLEQTGPRVLVVGLSGTERGDFDLGVTEAQETWFDALVIPGGPWVSRFASDAAVLELVTQFEIDAKPIAAIGRGLLVLAAAELVAGRRLAAEPSVREQVEEEGGRVTDDALVEDEMWITARGADRLDDLLDRLVASLRRIHLAARDAAGPLDS